MAGFKRPQQRGGRPAKKPGHRPGGRPGQGAPTEEVFRVRTPREHEILGIVEQRVGGSRMIVKCFDGKSRVCRIPGRLKRTLWVRENDIVLVEIWEHSGDERGDIVFKYRPLQAEWLQKNGYLKNMQDVDEF